MSTQHLITEQERDLINAALQRLKVWATDTAAQCKNGDLSWEGSQTVLVTAIVDGLMAVMPANTDRESFMQLMGKSYDAYHRKRGKESLQ
jgi:hypothetical protein